MVYTPISLEGILNGVFLSKVINFSGINNDDLDITYGKSSSGIFGYINATKY